jgi:hypothetical protein
VPETRQNPGYIGMLGPINFLMQLLGNRSLPAKRLPRALGYLLRFIVLWPFHLVDQVVSQAIHARRPPVEDPIFILGHYRSGTTYLHKLLVSNSNFAAPSTYDLLVPQFSAIGRRTLQPVLQWIADTFSVKQPFFNYDNANLADPNEEETLMASMGSLHSAHWSYVFPGRNPELYQKYVLFRDARDLRDWKRSYYSLVSRVAHQYAGKRLILKSPPNTGRVEHLLDLFPNAKFVFIYRNPYDVYYSTRRMLTEVVQRYIALESPPGRVSEDQVFENYLTLMDKYFETRSFIPEGNLVEISYESLRDNPAESVNHVYRRLGIPFPEEDRAALADFIKRESGYEPLRHLRAGKDDAAIQDKWGTYIDKLGYKDQVAEGQQ